MGAFEDFVNSNLGIRQPIISDFSPPTGENKSSKAAGIRGSKFIDLSTNFLYEKTGENNSTDWIKIAELGEPRGGGGAVTNLEGDQYIQFISGSNLAGSADFIYQYESGRVSGVSGYYQDIDGISGHLSDELIVGDLEQDNFVDISGSKFTIHGDLHVEGTIHSAGSSSTSSSSNSGPQYVGEISISDTPTWNGSSGLTVSKITETSSIKVSIDTAIQFRSIDGNGLSYTAEGVISDFQIFTDTLEGKSYSDTNSFADIQYPSNPGYGWHYIYKSEAFGVLFLFVPQGADARDYPLNNFSFFDDTNWAGFLSGGSDLSNHPGVGGDAVDYYSDDNSSPLSVSYIGGTTINQEFNFSNSSHGVFDQDYNAQINLGTSSKYRLAFDSAFSNVNDYKPFANCMDYASDRGSSVKISRSTSHVDFNPILPNGESLPDGSISVIIY